MKDWIGLFVPSTTPAETVNRLNGAARAALQSDKAKETFDGLTMEPDGESPADCANRVKAEYMMWVPSVKRLDSWRTTDGRWLLERPIYTTARGVPGGGLAKHFTGPGEGGVQRQRAASEVFEAVALSPSGRQRQHRVLGIQRLDGGLIIHNEYWRMQRRIRYSPITSAALASKSGSLEAR